MSNLSVESELYFKLENIFGFNYGKGKKFHDLGTRDFLDVYKIFFRIYDSAWLLNDEKPTSTVVKQIQSFLKRVELGHLVHKGEDLFDPKKNCRLLGAIVSKLESRHNGIQNVLAVVRKIRLLKQKTSSERSNQRKGNSSSGSTEEEEEPVIPELIVPHKGRELPRTPPSKSGTYSDDNQPDFLKPKIPVSPLAAPARTYSKQTTLVVTKKGFRPILPTKEIPRTPMKGLIAPVDTHDLSHNNPNLTVDFSASRITSSNTSTPYSSRSSANSGDATFVVLTKPSADLMEGDLKVEKKGLLSIDSAEEDSVFENEILTGTFVKDAKAQERKKPIFEDNWTLEMEENNDKLEDEKVASPGGKKKPGKEPKSNAVKEKSAKAEVPAKMKDDDKVVVSKAAEPAPENGHSADTDVNVAPKGKKGRGKKVGKKEIAEEPPVADSPVEVEPEAPAPVVEAEVKKSRGRVPSKKETVEENAVKDPVAITEAEPEPKGKKGRGKKAQPPAKPQESHPSCVEDCDPPPAIEVDQEKNKSTESAKAEGEIDDSEVQFKKGKNGNKKAVKDTPVEKVVEQKEDPPELPVDAVANSSEPKKKGRGKKNNQPAESAQTVADVETEANSELISSDVKGEKKGRQPTKQSNDEEQTLVEPIEVAAPEVKEKRGRGRQKVVVDEPKEKETSPKDESPAKVVESEPKEKKGRGRQAKEGADKAGANDKNKNEDSETRIVSDVKEKKERGGRKAKGQVDDTETNQVSIPETTAPTKKGRGKKATTKATEELEPEPEVEPAEEIKEVKSKGKKNGKQQVDKEEEAVKKAQVAEDESAEAEGPRKSSRHKNEPVKSYDESEKRRGRKKAEPKSNEEVVDDDKKKPSTKKKSADVVAETENEPPKVAAKRANKRAAVEETKEVEPAVEDKKRGAKKASAKSPELPLRVVNGDDEESDVSPPKRSKKEVASVTEEAEKKTAVRGRKKKEDQPSAENESPDHGTKKGAVKRGKDDVVTEEVEKKKPGRKKAIAAVEETETSPVQPKQRGKRAAVQPTPADPHVFVTYIAGQQSTDPSPAGPPPPKGRRLKLTEETTAAVVDDEASAPAPAVKRSYRNRK